MPFQPSLFQLLSKWLYPVTATHQYLKEAPCLLLEEHSFYSGAAHQVRKYTKIINTSQNVSMLDQPDLPVIKAGFPSSALWHCSDFLC